MTSYAIVILNFKAITNLKLMFLIGLVWT
uniref:Uncharacterized protein n=1 Tax=Rhizophora mucronata TaxID=61149 RepID=A0A2P2QV83_RHIMU